MSVGGSTIQTVCFEGQRMRAARWTNGERPGCKCVNNSCTRSISNCGKSSPVTQKAVWQDICYYLVSSIFSGFQCVFDHVMPSLCPCVRLTCGQLETMVCYVVKDSHLLHRPGRTFLYRFGIASFKSWHL